MGPLYGITVVELAGLGPGPYACMLLADMGADVITVDRPAGRSSIALTGGVVNRGKRSIALDLKDRASHAALMALLETADVVIEGYRPGVAERLGLGPEDVWARNPRVVYGRMTGWGQDGPLAQSAGHDIGYIALTGALHAMGEAHVAPQIPLNLVGDFGGGSTFLVMGVLAALLEVQRTGIGQVVDAAIVDGTSHLLSLMHTMVNAGQWSDQRQANMLDGGYPFYSVYETSDGRHMAVGALEPQFFAQLVELLGVEVGPQLDRAGWPAMRATFAARFVERTMAEWTSVFEGTDACVAPVLTMREAPAHPHVAARGSVLSDDGVLQPGSAPRFSGHVFVPAAAPVVGEHTGEVLSSLGRPSVVSP
ncbi:MAG: CoA transferase [Actinomycetota bacterium]|nr:CoA transferase [Actinomycetota bacterium]